MRSDIVPGGSFPDYELPDQTGELRKLSQLQGDDPLILTLARGHYCPKEHQQHLELAAFYPKIAVAYTQIATIATDDHHTLQEFRASVGAQWTFLSDPGRTIQKNLDIQEYTDPEHNPMIRHTLVLKPGLMIYSIYNGYWFWGRPSVIDLWHDLRAVTSEIRPDWDLSTPGLRYWVMNMHVDGFRFDLASVLRRDAHGNILREAPLLEGIAEDPILRDVKIIAEAWDAGGAYQVGDFSSTRWTEWNGRFRDDVRRFWAGDAGMLGSFARRICGSSDLYQSSGKGPARSLNFVTCHDGFTLNDLVSYKQKHNDENGEFNRDGADANYSDNCGVEGPSQDPNVEGMRNRLIKNFLLTLFISRGVPMLLGGDEFRRTQRGNNNAYCQDNEASWFDWSLLEKHEEMYRFTRGMIAFRRAHHVLRREKFYTDAEIKWFAPNSATPSWADQRQKSFACLILGETEPDLFILFNADTSPVDFFIPALPAGKIWRLAVDTSRTNPDDFFDPGKEPPIHSQNGFRLEPRSSAILVTDSDEVLRDN